MSAKIPTIAIVGGGASGTLVAVHLLREAHGPLKVKIIEPREQLGRGIAYSTQSSSHLLNVPASKMSAFPGESGHFVSWLRQYRDRGTQDYSFFSRLIYGQYLEQLFKDAKAGSRSNVSIEHLRDRAVCITPRGNHFSISLEKGSPFHAESVVLALGNGPASNPLSKPTKAEIVNAWSAAAVDRLPKDATVVLGGSGLTAIDVCLSLADKGHAGLIFMVSRHGLLPQVHLEAPVTVRQRVIAPSALTARALLHDVRESAAGEIARGGSWHAVIDSLRPGTNELWQSLPLNEKRRFMRHLRHYWEVYRHRMPADVHRRIEAMRTSGQLRVISGRLTSASAERSGNIRVRIQAKNPTGYVTISAARIINCTGPQNDPAKSLDPLVRQIVAEGIGRPDSLSMGLETAHKGALIRVDGTAWETIFAIGPIRKGALWETTAIPEIRSQAASVAREVLVAVEDSIRSMEGAERAPD